MRTRIGTGGAVVAAGRGGGTFDGEATGSGDEPQPISGVDARNATSAIDAGATKGVRLRRARHATLDPANRRM